MLCSEQASACFVNIMKLNHVLEAKKRSIFSDLSGVLIMLATTVIQLRSFCIGLVALMTPGIDIEELWKYNFYQSALTDLSFFFFRSKTRSMKACKKS